jgi:iron complex transport system ATP-binding protein
MENKTPILSTSNLEIGYTNGKENISILSHINLNIHQGELICLLGPNGSGKSTLLRTLGLLQKPLSGKIYLHQKEIQSYSRIQLAKNMSLVLTEKIGSNNFSVFELVALGRLPYTDWSGQLLDGDLQVIENALRITHTLSLKDRRIRELSDGQLQKVMIARAFAQEGDAMILDEPTAHLDIHNRVEIMSLLKNLAHETGKAILVSTHDWDLALSMADTFWLLNHDHNIISGIPEALILNGEFQKVFASPYYHFNLHQGKFVLNNQSGLTKISISGSSPQKEWTIHALRRNGFQIVEPLQTHPSIFILTEKDTITWQYSHNQNELIFQTLESLLEHLNITFRPNYYKGIQ